MELDLYSACPCGSGKKIKFCCPREHVNDYLKVFELIEAEQFAAAADLTDRLVAKAPQQICFLALKATFLDSEDEAATREMGRQLAAVAPNHPITHAAHAVIALYDEDLSQAIERIQESIERLESAVPLLLLTALSMTAGAALHVGKLQTAAAHAQYVQLLTKGRHTASGQLLGLIRSHTSLPPVLLSDILGRLRDVQGDKFPQRLGALVMRGKWRVARAEAQRLLQQQPGSAAALGVLATVCGSLGDDDAAIDYWKQLGNAPDVPEPLAVDALLMSACVSRKNSSMSEPLYEWSLTVHDADSTMERLLSHPRVRSTEVARNPDDDAPPPKAAFVMYDRPTSGIPENTKRADLPTKIVDLYLFGRETDREPRVELWVTESERERVKGELAEVLGDAVRGEREEQHVGYFPILQARLVNEFFVPDDATMEDRARWAQELIQDAIFKRFPEFPNPLIEGKTPLAAAGDPALRRPLLASLLWLETVPPFDVFDGDWQPLWDRLQLPRSLEVQSEEDVDRLGITNLCRLDFRKLSDELLLHVLNRTTNARLQAATSRVAEHVVSRPSLRAEYELHGVFELLMHFSSVPEKRLHWIDEAVAWCRERSRPEGRWLVQKFTWLLFSDRNEEAQQLLDRIVSRHKSEPGVMEDLHNVFVNLGIMTPDGRPAREVAAAAAAASSAPQTGIWTPDQGASEASAPKSGSKLWVPGMD